MFQCRTNICTYRATLNEKFFIDHFITFGDKSLAFTVKREIYALTPAGSSFSKIDYTLPAEHNLTSFYDPESSKNLIYMATEIEGEKKILSFDIFDDFAPDPTHVKSIEREGKFLGLWADPSSDFVFYLIQKSKNDKSLYAFNSSEGSAGKDFVSDGTVEEAWGNLGILDHVEKPKNFYGFSSSNVVLFTLNKTMYCGTDFGLGNCAICTNIEKSLVKANCLFCREKRLGNGKCEGKDPDLPPKNRCLKYYSYPRCFKKLHRPFKFFIQFHPGRSFVQRPHFKVYFRNSKIGTALKADRQLNLIKIADNFNVVQGGKTRALQAADKDACSKLKTFVLAAANTLEIFLSPSKECLKYFEKTRYSRNFTIDFGEGGETEYLKYDPPTFTFTLVPAQLRMLSLNSKSIADMPNKPSWFQVIKPQNLVNFGTQGLGNKTELLKEGGQLAQSAGYVIAPVFGISIISLTLMMSFLLRLVQKFELFNVNYGKIMRYSLEMGFKEKMMKLRPKLTKKEWYNYRVSNYRPLLTPYSHSYLSFRIHISKYGWIIGIFMIRLLRLCLVKKFKKWRAELGDDYFYVNEDDEESKKNNFLFFLEGKKMAFKHKILLLLFRISYIMEVALLSTLLKDFILSCGYDLLNYKILVKYYSSSLTYFDLFMSLFAVLVIGYELAR